jgi:hypothetical protein
VPGADHDYVELFRELHLIVWSVPQKILRVFLLSF